jgi:hypothetical protein
MKALVCFAFFAVIPGWALASEVRIPRSMAGDKGQYFLLEARTEAGVVKTLHKRVGPSGTGFTRTEINCKTMRIRDMGYSEDSVAAMKIAPGKWYELVAGSSKSDLANFVCKR